MGEFATIKAMGYPTSFFGALVITQALLLSIVSFVPGFLIAIVTFQAVNMATGLVMFLNFRTLSIGAGTDGPDVRDLRHDCTAKNYCPLTPRACF